jgi:glycosyltransferase involved in cell wall biosynthesis
MPSRNPPGQLRAAGLPQDHAVTPIRAAFVMEQTLGNVTHYLNLRAAVAQQSQVAPTWLPIPFAADGPTRLLPLFGRNWTVRASWRARRSLRAALARQSHAAVYFHSQVPSLFSLDIMRRLPTVISLDATPINFDRIGQYYGHRAAGDGWIDRQKYLLNRRAFHAAAALVTFSDWARRSLIDDYQVDPTQIRVLIPSGAAPAYFDIGERRLAGKASASGEHDPVRLLFVGGDFHRKGGPLLLDCMRAGLADRCELHLVTSEAIEPQPNVYLHCGVEPNSPELRQLYADADIFVLPTLADTLGLVLLEAAAAGLPVIATEVGAVPEAVQHGESGLLVTPGDARGLRTAIERLVGDPQLRQRMGHVGHALARQKFDARRNSQALLDLLAEVARTGPQSRRAA